MFFGYLFCSSYILCAATAILCLNHKTAKISVGVFAFLQFAIIMATVIIGKNRSLHFIRIKSEDFTLHLDFRVSSISSVFLLLTAFIYLCYFTYLSYSEKSIQRYEVILMLCTYAIAISLFTSINLFVIFTLFEALLIPTAYLLSAAKDGKPSLDTISKYLTYNFIGGSFMLFAIFRIHYYSPEFADNVYSKKPVTVNNHIDMLFIALSIAVALYIKSPFFPFHRWIIPIAQKSRARTVGVLSGLIDKTGLFLFYVLTLGLYGSWPVHTMKYVFLISGIVGICYFLMLIYRESSSLKKTLAFISVAHYSVMLIGMGLFTYYSLYAVLFYMFAHGITTILIFLFVDYMENNNLSYTEVLRETPFLLKIFLLLAFAVSSLPGSVNFIGELLIVIANFQVGLGGVAFFIIASSLVVMWILIKKYRQMITQDTLKITSTGQIASRNTYSFLFLIGVLIVFFLGVYPYYMLREAAELYSLLPN